MRPPLDPDPPARHGRLALLLLAVALVSGACVNQGFDEDPPVASEESPPDAAAPEPADAEPAEEPETSPESGPLPVGAVDDPAALAAIEEVACSFDERLPLPRRPVCYEVSVPEDWADPDPDDRVILPVAVFEADGAERPADATIYLDGGPGASTLDLLWTSFGQLHEPLVGPRDYVVFDQRGVGRAEPSLACPELTEAELRRLVDDLDPEAAEASAIGALTACRDRLASDGVDFADYNSVASANDVEAIRALLGYDRLNLVGVSYGTRLAQTHLRQYPYSVRAVVLDSIVPVEADLWTNVAPEARGAFEQLFGGCAADPACADAHPDLEERFFALLDRLDGQPVGVEFDDLLAGTTVPAVVDGDDVMGLVFSALYDRSAFALVPTMVAEAEAGTYDTIEFLGSVDVTNLPFMALGQQLSVECNEEIAFEDEAALVALAPTDPGYDRLLSLVDEPSLFELCRRWGAGVAPVEESVRVESEVPALLLGGAYDPITRPSNIDPVAAGLTNSYSFVLPHEGHGIVSSPCGAELVTAFLDDPTQEPDGSCVASTPAPAWVPGVGDGEVTLVEFAVDGPSPLTGVRPEGWIDAGSGIFARQRTAIDPTSLIVQPTGGLVPSFVVELLEGQLGVTFVEDLALDAGGREWQAFRSDDDPDQAVRLAASPGRDGALVVLVTTADEVDALYESVFLPALDAVEVG